MPESSTNGARALQVHGGPRGRGGSRSRLPRNLHGNNGRGPGQSDVLVLGIPYIIPTRNRYEPDHRHCLGLATSSHVPNSPMVKPGACQSPRSVGFHQILTLLPRFFEGCAETPTPTIDEIRSGKRPPLVHEPVPDVARVPRRAPCYMWSGGARARHAGRIFVGGEPSPSQNRIPSGPARSRRGGDGEGNKSVVPRKYFHAPTIMIAECVRAGDERAKERENE